MRIVHVIPMVAARIGGPPAVVVGIARALDRLGHESTILSTDLREPPGFGASVGLRADELPEGARDVDVRLFRCLAPRRFAYAPSLRRAVRDEAGRADVVHVHMLFLYPQLAAFREAKASRTPFVVSPHGALEPHLRRKNAVVKAANDVLWQRRMLRDAAAVHLTSEGEAESIADLRLAPPAAVVPAGIDLGPFADRRDGSAFRRRRLDGVEGPLVLAVGRLSARKRFDVLVRAFAAVAAEVPGARLAIAGPDDEELAGPLRALASDLGVGDRVVLTGMLDRPELLDALAACTVYASTSRAENFGLTVVEALAAGRPAVVSTGVGIAAELAAAEAAVVCEPEPAAVAEALVGLLRDPQRGEALAERGRRFAERLSWDAVAPRYVELYERVAASAA